jgi:hypothetical protein
VESVTTLFFTLTLIETLLRGLLALIFLIRLLIARASAASLI